MTATTPIPTENFFLTAISEIKITEERSKLLDVIAASICREIINKKVVNLNFICTHNSRRSQIAQVWSNFASDYFGLKAIESFSGGTAITSFFRNTVHTLEEVGFLFQLLEFSHQNPIYEIKYKGNKDPIIGYSKIYNDIANKKPYIAITTCSNAESNCPFIPDALERFHMPYTDPKIYDNTAEWPQKYLETNRQIAGEMHYLYNKIKNSI